MMDDLARALNQERRALHRCYVPADPGATEIVALRCAFDSDQIDRMLRIEIDEAHVPEFWRYAKHSLDSFRRPGGDEGPQKFQGVDLYVVDRLPAPGWRIINPMRN